MRVSFCFISATRSAGTLQSSLLSPRIPPPKRSLPSRTGSVVPSTLKVLPSGKALTSTLADHGPLMLAPCDVVYPG